MANTSVKGTRANKNYYGRFYKENYGHLSLENSSKIKRLLKSTSTLYAKNDEISCKVTIFVIQIFGFTKMGQGKDCVRLCVRSCQIARKLGLRSACFFL